MLCPIVSGPVKGFAVKEGIAARYWLVLIWKAGSYQNARCLANHKIYPAT